MKKYKEKVLNCNLKKYFAIWLVAAAIFCVALGTTASLGYTDQMRTLKTTVEQRVAHGHHDQIAASKNDGTSKAGQSMNLTTTDKVVAGSFAGAAAVLGVAYWLLCIAWAYRKSYKLGKGVRLWTVMTIFFNLCAIAAMYIWAGVMGTCDECGHIKGRDDQYCSRCGNRFVKDCSKCGAVVPAKSKYCTACGNKLDQ